jgi:hypothetical protein
VEPYPVIGRWIFPVDACSVTLKAVAPAGRLGNEAGAFWLGERATVSRVTTVVLPKGVGVEEQRNQWHVAPEVFGTVSRWAKPRGLTLLGIAHTHGKGGPARLSWVDRARGVHVPGILAVVIGDGGENPDPLEWGWYVYEGSDYRVLSRVELMARVEVPTDNRVDVFNADAHGVYLPSLNSP